MMLSLLVWFVPVAPYVKVFALRNRKEIDFAAYMRAKQEAFFRQQQQYRNMYGNPNNPNNPYGTYTWGPTPNGQNPYARNTSQTNEQKPEDEPFSEFSSNKKPEKDSSHSNENGDGFFD
jgi:type II secretory pathway pseudopilin PulG